MKRERKIKYFVNEVVSRPISKKEFLIRQKEEIVGDCILQSVVLKNKSFTKTQINQLVKAKILLPMKYKSKIYFKKDEIIKGLKYISEPPKLFSM